MQSFRCNFYWIVLCLRNFKCKSSANSSAPLSATPNSSFCAFFHRSRSLLLSAYLDIPTMSLHRQMHPHLHYQVQRQIHTFCHLLAHFQLLFNPIQDVHYWGCSRISGGKTTPPPSSLKSVTHIIQWWSLAQLCLT